MSETKSQISSPIHATGVPSAALQIKPGVVHITPPSIQPQPTHPQPGRTHVQPMVRLPKAVALTDAVAARTIPYQSGMDYGVGVDSPSGSAMNVAATGSPTSIPLSSGEQLSYSLVEISTEEELQTALGISASASGGIGLFSASARMDYAKSCAINTSSVFALISVQITEAFQSIKSPGIDPAAAAVLANGNEQRFRQQYGDMFVRGIQSGGVFFGLIEIQTKDETDKESVSASVSASYAAFSASGQFSQSFQDTVKNRGLRVTCHIEGGTLPSPLPTSVDGLVQAAGQWVPTVKNNAVPYLVLLDGYSILPLPNPPNFADLQHQMDVLAQCAVWRNMDLQTLNDIAFIKSNPEQFTALNMAQLSQSENDISADLNTIAAAASNAINNPMSAALPQLKVPPPLPLPARVPTLMVTIPDWGDMETMDRGTSSIPSADSLGLITVVTMLPNNNPNVEGDIASMSLAPGTQVARGTKLNVSIWGRAPGD
jgi:hypothetical protein